MQSGSNGQVLDTVELTKTIKSLLAEYIRSVEVVKVSNDRCESTEEFKVKCLAKIQAYQSLENKMTQLFAYCKANPADKTTRNEFKAIDVESKKYHALCEQYIIEHGAKMREKLVLKAIQSGEQVEKQRKVVEESKEAVEKSAAELKELGEEFLKSTNVVMGKVDQFLCSTKKLIETMERDVKDEMKEQETKEMVSQMQSLSFNPNARGNMHSFLRAPVPSAPPAPNRNHIVIPGGHDISVSSKSMSNSQ